VTYLMVLAFAACATVFDSIVSTIAPVALNCGGWYEVRWGRDRRTVAAIRDVGLQVGCRQRRVYGKPHSR